MTTVFGVTTKLSRDFLCLKKKVLFYLTELNMSDSRPSTMKRIQKALDHHECIRRIKEFIPKLTSNLSKGDCGKIGIIGGSFEYTGAPFFSGMAALRTGADLVYIFCSSDAGMPIKSYSPELIVHPILDKPDAIKLISVWLPRLNALVIGPGLGRHANILSNVEGIINYCKDNVHPSPPLIIDADGLFLLKENRGLINGYKGPVFITPNELEFKRLCLTFPSSDMFEVAISLNVVLIQKGVRDIIINGIQGEKFNFGPNDIMLACDLIGSNRRCGGQGDILSGCLATFAAWYHNYKLMKSNTFYKNFMTFTPSEDKEERIAQFHDLFLGYSLCAYGACMIAKNSSALAFHKYGRSMTSSEIILYIYQAFKSIFNL